MAQSDIILDITNQLSEKLQKLAETKVYDPADISKTGNDKFITITLFSIEEINIKNSMERIKCKQQDKNGNVIEYFASQPSIFNCSFMITPHCKSQVESLKMTGAIITLLKDDDTIKIDEFDWLENNKKPVYILPLHGMTLEKQVTLFTLLKMDYRPSLFYQMTVGINSEKKEEFRRVEMKKFTTEIKKT